MSLWSKIGLPDQAMISAMQEEIHALRKENQQLMLQQSELLQKLSQQTDSISNSQVAEFLQIRNTLDPLQSSLLSMVDGTEGRLRKLHEDDHAQLMQHLQAGNDSLMQTINGQFEQHRHQLSELSTTSSALDDRLKRLQGTLDETLSHAKDGNELSQKISDAIDAQRALLESEQLQTAVKDIPDIRDFVVQLWEAMKLVWINDLLDDCDN